MDRLVETVEEETARVRAGRLRDAAELDRGQSRTRPPLYRRKRPREGGQRAHRPRRCPTRSNALRKRHDAFQALLQTNLTVLATAHAVSEGIIRGVSGELARKRAPSTYGASGRANAPSGKASPPLAISRTL